MTRPANVVIWRVALSTILVLALGGAGDCGYLEKQRIERAAAGMESSALAGDAAGYLSYLAPDYSDVWVPADQTRAKFTARFSRRPPPSFSFGKKEIERNGDRAVVTEHFTLDDRIEGRTRHYEEVQHLVWERRAEGWKCISGSKFLALIGGQMEEEHALEQVLFRRENALVKKDIDAYMELISPNYHHKGEGPGELRERVSDIFQVYDQIEFRSFDRRIYYFGDAAEVQQKFSMTAAQMGKPMSFNGEERFELVKMEDGWKFTKGL